MQRDHFHLHLIVEAHDGSVLARGMQGLGIRLARAINKLLHIRGSVFEGRFHGHELRTPREVRNALVYVLMNFKKHERVPRRSLDPLSSAAWFDGFREAIGPPPTEMGRPVVASRTWLASRGWRRRGLVGLSEAPLPSS